MPANNTNYNLIFERTTTLTPEQIWKAWTDPETLMKWFCPRPWKVTDCRIDLKAGGEFYTVMQSPEGQQFPNAGCFLEVVPNKKLVWTNMMTKDFVPATDEKMGFAFTVTLTLSRIGNETLYKAVVAHANDDGKKQHEQMGFQEGWGAAFNQLLELF